MLKPYQELVERLKSLVDTIGQYHTQRDTLTSHANSLHQARAKLSDRILDSNGGDTSELIKELEKIELEQKLGGSRWDALTVRTEVAEKELHELLPKAGPTFQRLRKSIYDRTLAMETAVALQRVSSAKAGNAQRLAEDLASMSIAVEEVLALVVPDCSSFYTTRAFKDTNYPERWSRQEVVLALLEVTNKLINSVESLLARVNSLGEGFEVPIFVLGDVEPAAASTTPPGFTATRAKPAFEWATMDLRERQYLEQLLKDAGKTIGELTEWDLQILAKQLETGRNAPGGVPNVSDRVIHTSTRADPQIEVNRQRPQERPMRENPMREVRLGEEKQ